MKIHRSVLLIVLTSLFSVSARSEISFIPTGVIDMIPTSMSDDASIVVGTGPFQIPNFYYTEAAGASIIGDGCFSGLPSISGDGSTVLGCHTDSQGLWNAARWLGGTNWEDLGTVAGGIPCDLFLSGPFGLNYDGSLGVGLVYLPTLCKAGAGTWDLVNGGPANQLPPLFVGPSSRANASNADGSVIVGWQDQPTGERTAAKWVNAVPEPILTQSGGLNGEAHAVSADGNIIVGESYNFGASAWIWRPATGVLPLGGGASASAPAVPAAYVALDVSNNGQFVVGFVNRSGTSKAVIWRDGVKRNILLEEFLKKRGVTVPDGWHLSVANAISADGSTIYGWGFNPDNVIEMFKVVLR